MVWKVARIRVYSCQQTLKTLNREGYERLPDYSYTQNTLCQQNITCTDISYFLTAEGEMASPGMSAERHSMNALSNGQFQDPSHASISLPSVDAKKLKARLYSYAPKQAAVNPHQLQFRGPTNVQRKTMAVPSAPRIEPLVSLMQHGYILSVEKVKAQHIVFG